MKRIAMMMHLCVGAASVVYGQQESAVTDSLWKVSLQEVEVVSIRATRNTPVAFTNIGKEELQKQNLGQDLPYLLSMTPSAISTSDAGGEKWEIHHGNTPIAFSPDFIWNNRLSYQYQKFKVSLQSM